MIKKQFYNKRNNNSNLVAKTLKDYFGSFLRVVLSYNRMNLPKTKFLIRSTSHKKRGDSETLER